jgi:hypothetical protein
MFGRYTNPLTSFEPVCDLARLPEIVVVSDITLSHACRSRERGTQRRRRDDGKFWGQPGSCHVAVEMLGSPPTPL